MVPGYREGIVGAVDSTERNAGNVQGESTARALRAHSIEGALSLSTHPASGDEEDLARWENEGGAIAEPAAIAPAVAD